MPIKAKELKQKPIQELENMLKESREALRVLRFDLASRKLKDTSSINSTRKQIAQILTILKQL